MIDASNVCESIINLLRNKNNTLENVIVLVLRNFKDDLATFDVPANRNKMKLNLAFADSSTDN